MYREYNKNPFGKRVGDCTVRAISEALGEDWDTVFTGLWVEGYKMKDMPSSNAVWGAYLRSKGWVRNVLPNTCPDCYTVREFTLDHPKGIFIAAIDGHVVCINDGDWLDTFDSGDMTPIYYWEKGREEE